MSQINVNRIKDSNEGAPDFPSGVNVSGITSTVTLGVTNLNTTNLNVSGVVTATTFDGTLPTTGTPTLGLGVTINASGVNISGVATAGIVSATTLYGDGSNITGIALTIAPLNYNPAVYSQSSHLAKASGIGITFNQGVKAGSGNVTLSLANAGVAGTVVENFGVGNSVTYSGGDTITITPTADLSVGQNYHLSYPSGAFTNIGGDVSYVGTAYTFQARTYDYQLWSWGNNEFGALGINAAHDAHRSSPVQVPGTNWSYVADGGTPAQRGAVKSDGTLWMWGNNSFGQLGKNDRTNRSSPTQIPGTTWTQNVSIGNKYVLATKTDGTLWSWGRAEKGTVGLNTPSDTHPSSPTQIPGTTWTKDDKDKLGCIYQKSFAIKTDGTLWAWGQNDEGELGVNNRTNYSSPVQIPGTTWAKVARDGFSAQGAAIKTDGTLWMWGNNDNGGLGQNTEGNPGRRSSPTQIPGTTWKEVIGDNNGAWKAIKTDGTLWTWGNNQSGQLGQNNKTLYSSPTQVPGTTWSDVSSGTSTTILLKTDGTFWSMGYNNIGGLGQNNVVSYSSPVQIPGTTWTENYAGDGTAIKQA